MQTMAQVSKQNTATTLTPSKAHTPTIPVQTQFLQKQLEQPLKMDNHNMTMQPITQHPPTNQTQMQQFQINQQQKSLPIVSFRLGFF